MYNTKEDGRFKQNFHMNDQFFLCEAEATILEKL